VDNSDTHAKLQMMDMGHMRQYLCGVSWVLFLLAALNGCDNGVKPVNNMPTNGKAIEVVTPTAGDYYTVGQTVRISFKIDAAQITGCTPAVSIDGGKTWCDITLQITPSKTSGGELLSYDWVIGQEDETVAYAGTMTACRIKVSLYGEDTVNDQTGFFTIVE
jgi:hypothetical protein